MTSCLLLEVLELLLLLASSQLEQLPVLASRLLLLYFVLDRYNFHSVTTLVSASACDWQVSPAKFYSGVISWHEKRTVFLEVEDVFFKSSVVESIADRLYEWFKLPSPYNF